MKKIFALLLVVSMLLCGCATNVQRSNRNVGKPLEETTPTGSHVHTWGDWTIIKRSNPREVGEKHTFAQSAVLPRVRRFP